MSSLRMSCQPQWQYLDYTSKRRNQRKACLGLSKAFDKVRGTTGKFLAPVYTKKRGEIHLPPLEDTFIPTPYAHNTVNKGK